MPIWSNLVQDWLVFSTVMPTATDFMIVNRLKIWDFLIIWIFRNLVNLWKSSGSNFQAIQGGYLGLKPIIMMSRCLGIQCRAHSYKISLTFSYSIQQTDWPFVNCLFQRFVNNWLTQTPLPITYYLNYSNYWPTVCRRLKLTID